ncbi:curli-like amyloid fiber formation chaperone CsgH [Hymenobacter sp. CRA2]|uniref:curli-like amyloid fiber formation chaperone CsgH n=1 Tax=Hymenobacter sp. CRA2 TaxID=1955620 RepID=UPI000990029E|nr:curli-like amyloid fiber formation chaperone CsgH [Hymenobacter sp. CRA2]OON68613.1 hypothetical protein B0919_13315 [Hymenobacter sp. CRA2]
MIPLFLALGLWTTPGAAPYVARIEARQQGEQLTIVAHCLNQTAEPVALRYELRSERQGQSGTSRNTQSGNCRALPGQEVALGRSSFNVTAQDSYRIRLVLLTAEGRVVAADSLVHPSQR